MKTNTKALAFGLVAYLAAYSLKYGYEAILFSSDAIGSQNRLIFFPSTILALMILVIPSYISGLFVDDKGTLIGFLVCHNRLQHPIFRSFSKMEYPSIGFIYHFNMA